MSADSAVTYTSVHSEARSWSIPSEDPYEEAAQQLFEQAPRYPEYVPEDHIPVYIPEPEHPEDLVPYDKVKFAMCTFEGRALTWWNGNVQTLGLANANQIPWSNVKAMMTTEYCPATEIQRMEQELWTLTLKGDDIEAYNNRFHELVLMCPELVSTEKKKIEKYIRGFPEGIKGNVTSSKPLLLHDAINMAQELIEQGVQAKALRIGDSNKRKWEDQQGNNHHQQQNRRQEAAKVYVAAPAKGRGYAGNLPWCNRCKAHHQPGPCPPRCGTCHKLGHQEGDCRTRIPVARDNSLQNVTCFGCGNHGHYMSDCPS
ncbi:putative reverse transcriptase domain-containing protein [Tanacetum coccineum]